MRVRVKYCGGCNPRYDRKAVVERLRAAFPSVEFAEAQDSQPVDYVAVLGGCSSSCAMHDDLRGRKGKTVISSEEEFQRLADAIRQAGGA